MHKYTLWYRKCIGDQWNRLTPRERAEKEGFIAGEKSIIRGYMRMVCSKHTLIQLNWFGNNSFCLFIGYKSAGPFESNG